MKSAHLFCLVVCLLFAAFVHAQELNDPVKLEQMKQSVLKDVKKACAPQRKQSDNNQEGYWDAVSQVDCMEDY